MTRALIFDCDGVLADTERDGHRVAFNRMFEELGVPLHWDDETYGALVEIGGGKERMAHALTDEVAEGLGGQGAPDQREELLRRWHARKTAIFRELVAAGALPARPGVARLVQDALAAGWKVAVASTSAQESVRAVLESVVGVDNADRVQIYAGDVVPRKKPAPDIYLYACQDLGVAPEDVVVVEDSGIGCASAAAAGLSVVVTVSSYTGADDFPGAAVVISDLGEPAQAATVLADPRSLLDREHVVVDLSVLDSLLAASTSG